MIDRKYTPDPPAPASTRQIVFVSIPIPLDTLMLLEVLSTDELPIENLASLLLANATREANRLQLERLNP